jgi:serine/threonine-protein kinase
MHLAPGDCVDHYEILGFVGEGGMGTVYRARDQKLERVIALKVLREDSDPEFVRRLRKEALAAAALSHPNVVSVYDVGTAAGVVYLAMEFVEGTSLRAYVGNNTDAAWNDKLRWMLDAARALDAAHQVGIVHRDVKPENIVLRKDGVVKVLDFGIARRAVGEEPSNSSPRVITPAPSPRSRGNHGAVVTNFDPIDPDATTGRALFDPAHESSVLRDAVTQGGGSLAARASQMDRVARDVASTSPTDVQTMQSAPSLVAAPVAVPAKLVQADGAPADGAQSPTTQASRVPSTGDVLAPPDYPMLPSGALPAGSDDATGHGQILGTPAYMAPEQLKGQPALPASDQFAWAVTTFELLSGERPWKKAQTLVTFVANMMSEPPVSLRSRVDVPEGVERALLRALARDPAERFSNLNQAIQALEPFVSRTTINADRITLKPLVSTRDDDAYQATTRVPTVTSTAPASTNTTDRARPFGFPRWVWLLFAVGLVATGFFLRGVKKPGPGIGVMVSTVPLAEQAYREGTTLFRDGALERAERAFEQAIEADPECAAAHMQLALLQFNTRRDAALEHYRAAFSRRISLSPRDADLLDASEPFLRPQSDLEEWQTRMLRISRRYPKDVVLHYYLGLSRERMFDYDGAKDAYSKALGLDAQFVLAYGARARTEHLLGNDKGALEDYDRCLRASPVATACLRERVMLLVQAGSCARAKDDAERWVGMDSKDPSAHSTLAAVLVAQDAPLPAVEEVLKRAWALGAASKDSTGELRDRARLAAVQGDFARAEALALAWDKALPPDANSTTHAAASHLLVWARLEAGDNKGAAAAAKTFLDRRASFPNDAWTPDPSAWFYAPLVHGGGMSRADWLKARTSWLQAEEAMDRQKERERQATYRWTMLHGIEVESAEMAREAIAALPRFAPLAVAGARTVETDWILGRTFALAGNKAEARNFLEPAVKRCALFDAPFAMQRARLELAKVLETSDQVGDRDAAKELYRGILKRWGQARPRSITALEAGHRLEELQRVTP